MTVAYFRLTAPTLRLDCAAVEALVDEYIRQGKSVLFCIWHEVSFIGFPWFQHRNGSALIEASLKGDVLAAVANYYGFKDFRIKDDPGDTQTVRNTIAFIRHLRGGGHGTIALDGPNGPYRAAKPGFVQIAKKSGAVIIPGGIAYSHKITFKRRWDRYQLPLPWSKVVLAANKPLELPPDLPAEREQAVYDEIVAEVNKAMLDAAERIKKPGV